MAVPMDIRNRLQRHRIWDTIYRQIMLTVQLHMNQEIIQSTIQTSSECTVSGTSVNRLVLFLFPGQFEIEWKAIKINMCLSN